MASVLSLWYNRWAQILVTHISDGKRMTYRLQPLLRLVTTLFPTSCGLWCLTPLLGSQFYAQHSHSSAAMRRDQHNKEPRKLCSVCDHWHYQPSPRPPRHLEAAKGPWRYMEFVVPPGKFTTSDPTILQLCQSFDLNPVQGVIWIVVALLMYCVPLVRHEPPSRVLDSRYSRYAFVLSRHSSF